MKKVSIAILLVSIALTSFGQNIDLRRKIDVVGVAEREVTPDIINVTISLKEYMDGKNKISISKLESALEKAVQEAGIPKADLTVNDLSAYQQTVSKKKDPNFLASKQYGIRFRDLNKFNQILSKLDSKGIQYTNVDSYDYSKMAELKQELKIAALISAKDKATALVGALNEKLGQVLSIVDNDENMGNYPAPRAMMFKSMEAADSVAPESDINTRRIKLSFRVNATFEIGK